MKKNKNQIIGGGVATKFAILFAFIVVFAACEKDDAFEAEKSFQTESIAAAADGDGDLKRGRPANAPGDASIAEIAIGAGFSELVGALAYVDEELDAGLVNLFLNGTDQFTVFAPTNEAFEALYDAFEGVNDITDLPASLVLDVLLYHVVEGRRASNSVVPPVRPRTMTTLLGATFSVDRNGQITAIGNTANIVAADISASNGIIHVIDAVILPL